MKRAVKVTRFDQFLISVAPRWGLRRVRARAAANVMKRSYEAAGTGRRTTGWRKTSTDADGAIGSDGQKLRELSRDLRRNNWAAKRAIKAISNSTVGHGIRAKSATTDADLAAESQRLWDDWAKSTRCDFDGRLSWNGLQRLIMDTIAESGEALILRRAASNDDRLSVPLRIRVLEPDYLDTSHDTMGNREDGTRVSRGIEFDSSGRRLAYYIRDEHPGATRSFNTRSQRVPADEVIHVYYVERAGQSRGIPWLAAAVAKIHDLDDFEDAALMQQKIAACFGAFVQDADGFNDSIGDEDDDDEKLETIEPGQIQYLSQNKTVSFAQPPTPTEQKFAMNAKREIAAAVGITYEQLTGDYSQVNYSSARMARLEHMANVRDWRHTMFIPSVCEVVWEWVIGLASELGGWGDVPGVTWAEPPIQMLDPDKEGLAYTRQMRGGVKSWIQVVREQGRDPEAHAAEIAEGNALLDRYEIVLDSDPRKVSSSGVEQPSEIDTEASPAGDTG